MNQFQLHTKEKMTLYLKWCPTSWGSGIGEAEAGILTIEQSAFNNWPLVATVRPQEGTWSGNCSIEGGGGQAASLASCTQRGFMEYFGHADSALLKPIYLIRVTTHMQFLVVWHNQYCMQITTTTCYGSCRPFCRTRHLHSCLSCDNTCHNVECTCCAAMAEAQGTSCMRKAM